MSSIGTSECRGPNSHVANRGSNPSFVVCDSGTRLRHEWSLVLTRSKAARVGY